MQGANHNKNKYNNCRNSMEDISSQCIVGETIQIDLDDLDEQYEDECAIGPCLDDPAKKEKAFPLKKYDPKFDNLKVNPGLNLKGKCQNKGCLSNTNKTKNVWIPKGFGEFDITEECFENKCPSCGDMVQPQTILAFGITKAQANITGRKKAWYPSSKDKFKKVNRMIEETEGKFMEIKSPLKDKTWIILKMKLTPI